jgi:hypothetical protein
VRKSKSKSSPTKPSTDVIWNIISSAKGKISKGKGANDDGGVNGDGVTDDEDERRSSVSDGHEHHGKGKQKRSVSRHYDDSPPLDHSDESVTLRHRKRKMAGLHSEASAPRKRRKTELSVNGHSEHINMPPPTESASASLSGTKLRNRSSARLATLVRFHIVYARFLLNITFLEQCYLTISGCLTR